MLQRICAIFLLAASLTLAGCVYKIDIQQGNIITPAQAQQIHNGMSAQAVVKKLGAPILINPYADGRVIYIYSFRHGGASKMQVKKLILYFRDNRLVKREVSDEMKKV